jgi:hypothetical protein
VLIGQRGGRFSVLDSGTHLCELLLAFDLGIDLGAEEKRDVGQPQPDEEDYRRGERAVSHVEAREMRDEH